MPSSHDGKPTPATIFVEAGKFQKTGRSPATTSHFPERMSMQTTLPQHPIHPDRLYTSAEVAEYLHLHPDTVYRIPASQLARTRIGPRGGRTKVLGADLLAYLRRRG